MEKLKNALWRIEFATDASRADAHLITLGYMLEADWQGQARWLGLTFRSKLMPLELDRVNLDTWPELKDLEPFMRSLFDQAWDAADGFLGSMTVASRYPVYSALRFTHEDASLDIGGEFKGWDTHATLVSKLLALQPNLEPQLKADLVKLPQKKLPPVAPDPTEYELLSKKQQAAA